MPMADEKSLPDQLQDSVDEQIAEIMDEYHQRQQSEKFYREVTQPLAEQKDIDNKSDNPQKSLE